MGQHSKALTGKKVWKMDRDTEIKIRRGVLKK